MNRIVFVRGLIGAGVAAFGDVLIFLLARAAGIPFEVPVPLLDGASIPWYVIAIVAAGAAIAGAGLAWLLGRKRPNSAPDVFTWTVAAVAVLSCIPLLALGLAADSTVALATMHVLPGIVVLVMLQPVLRREAARFKM